MTWIVKIWEYKSSSSSRSCKCRSSRSEFAKSWEAMSESLAWLFWVFSSSRAFFRSEAFSDFSILLIFQKFFKKLSAFVWKIVSFEFSSSFVEVTQNFFLFSPKTTCFSTLMIEFYLYFSNEIFRRITINLSPIAYFDQCRALFHTYNNTSNNNLTPDFYIVGDLWLSLHLYHHVCILPDH